MFKRTIINRGGSYDSFTAYTYGRDDNDVNGESACCIMDPFGMWKDWNVMRIVSIWNLSLELTSLLQMWVNLLILRVLLITIKIPQIYPKLTFHLDPFITAATAITNDATVFRHMVNHHLL